MNLSDETEDEELSEPEFTHHVVSVGISTSGFLLFRDHSG